MSTTTTKEQATRTGARIAKQLGREWAFEVWENLGWHWRAWLPVGDDIVWVASSGPRDGSYRAHLSNVDRFPGIERMGERKRNARAAVSNLMLQIAIDAKRLDGIHARWMETL